MSTSAYVLVTVDPTQTKEVVEHLRDIPRLVVREVLGPYDLVIELESDSPENLTAVLQQRIRPIQGITSTVTCIWV